MNLFETLDLRLRLPVVGSPMFIASGPELVTAQCQSGIIGGFPTLNARPASMLADWFAEITESNANWTAAHPERPAAPFAANLIVHRSNNRLEADLAEVVRHEVPIVITSLGAREEVNEAVHSYGGVVLHDVINNRFAHKAVEKGADGIIAVAAGAGGHAGALSPFALVQEIRSWFDGPLLLSGAIAHGQSILAALTAGADFAYIGSAFLSTHEANVVDEYRQMIVDSVADDVVYSNYFTGVKGNYLRGSIVAAGLDPDALPEADPTKMDFGTDPESGTSAKAWKDIWGSGQGIGALGLQCSTADLVDRLVGEYEAAQAQLQTRLARTQSAPTQAAGTL
ncbi:NAD(P)H-dependent flavin oxidoreductase [Brevibacterium casei]|uniref:NAD(P)H-dependent flavin oxidoreductase n=1 Tax=Brevibacterium casei TaxID=33889 RepID=UPI00223B79D7|nr:nitronate monooxygenase family protein [Brevibacterium casei]MCT1552090.1 nitronate monooxygenase family protein [Brevibacterium casei]MCT1561897.1 nitronate monooxygenase family protein [Brevibacterium casei]MCT2209805.1 nitronate monooxygenase family protein [Brevibacterium casei]